MLKWDTAQDKHLARSSADFGAPSIRTEALRSLPTSTKAIFICARIVRELDMLPEIWTGRMVHDKQTPIRQRSDGMAAVCGHNGNDAWLCNPGYSVDGYLKLTLNHFVDLFLRMEVFVNRRSGCELVVRERHAARVKIASFPPR
jgi:hypothetical protein